MDGWDVLNTAVSAGVTGFIAIVITRAARSHEREKEFRQHQRDILSKVAVTVDECDAGLTEAAASFGVVASRDKNNAPEAFLKSQETLLAELDALRNSRKQLDRWETQLELVGSHESLAALKEFDRVTGEYLGKLYEHPPGPGNPTGAPEQFEAWIDWPAQNA